MDSFEINKIVAAILLVALLLIGINQVSSVIFYVEKPKTPGYAVDVEQSVTTQLKTEGETVEQKIDIAALMAMGDIATGEKVFKKFKIEKKIMNFAKKDCIFLHCLPRGKEVDEKVFSSNKSKVWLQAHNRVHVQKSILLYCFGKLR